MTLLLWSMARLMTSSLGTMRPFVIVIPTPRC